MRRVFYYPLEPIPERYTEQLSEDWMPRFLKEAGLPDGSLWRVGERERDVAWTITGGRIKTGQVLDATHRGRFSLNQNSDMLSLIENGQVTDEDVIFLQDFWTPGFDAVLYSLHLHDLHPHIYAMVHAQSVDEFDFTYPMRGWMGDIELGLATMMSGVFVASTVHREQLRERGWPCPIHVVSLPYHFTSVREKFHGIVPTTSPSISERTVVYSSRLDAEKNPRFMLEVADGYLRRDHGGNRRWIVCSSGPLRSNEPGVLEKVEDLDRAHRNFHVLEGLTKRQYYETLAACSVQFNSSLQDYVSWTMLEACTFGCDLAYPRYRSFPEAIGIEECMYTPGNVRSAVELVERRVNDARLRWRPALIAEKGGRKAAEIVLRGSPRETNIHWENRLW